MCQVVPFYALLCSWRECQNIGTPRGELEWMQKYHGRDKISFIGDIEKIIPFELPVTQPRRNTGPNGVVFGCRLAVRIKGACARYMISQ